LKARQDQQMTPSADDDEQYTGDRHCHYIYCQISRRRSSKATVHDEHAQLELTFVTYRTELTFVTYKRSNRPIAKISIFNMTTVSICVLLSQIKYLDVLARIHARRRLRHSFMAARTDHIRFGTSHAPDSTLSDSASSTS